MKKIMFLFVCMMVQTLTNAQLIDRGGYADYKKGFTHKYHLDNVRRLVDKSGIDTTGYTLVAFLPSGELINKLINTEKRSYVTMEINNNEITSYTITNHEAKNPQSNSSKIYCVFYFRSDLENKITYYFYRYG